MKNEEFTSNLTKLQSGDIGSLEIIYNEYYKKIFYVAYDLCRCKDNAHDIAMDVILKLCNTNIDPQSIRNHKSFLIVMTKNYAKDYLKKRKNETPIDECATRELSKEFDDGLYIDDILNALSDAEKVVFIEHVIWDKKLKTIAQEQSMPYITIKRLYANIKKKIKIIYKKWR